MYLLSNNQAARAPFYRQENDRKKGLKMLNKHQSSAEVETDRISFLLEIRVCFMHEGINRTHPFYFNDYFTPLASFHR